MDIWTMVAALSGPEGERATARDRLAATGPVAVVPVLAALWEEVIPWGEGVEVLRRASLEGFATERRRLESLVEGVCSAKRPGSVRGAARQRLWAEVAEAARWMHDPDWGTAPDFLPDPSDHRLLGHRPSWAPLFVPLLNEPEHPRHHYPTEHPTDDEHKRYRIRFDYLVGLGDQVVPMLRAVRRSLLPQRHEALKVLACIGWCHLDARDRAMMGRVLARMTKREPPPDRRWLSGEWYALQTGNQDAVLTELDLSDPVAVPVTVGLSAISHQDCARVYVSPAIDGWTLVVGLPGVTPPPRDRWLHGSPDQVVESQLTRLSRRFGRAYHFRLTDEYEDPDSCNVWRLAEKGTIIDEFRPTFNDVASDRWTRLGVVDEDEFHTWLETEFMHECGAVARRPGEAALDWARRLAESEDEQDWSVLPSALYVGPLSCQAVSARMAGWFGPGARVEGDGVLTLTEYGRRSGHRGLLQL